MIKNTRPITACLLSLTFSISLSGQEQFYDDFNDGRIDDAAPTSWHGFEPSDLLHVQAGDLVLSATLPDLNAEAVLELDSPLTGVSLRTQAKTRDGDELSIVVRAIASEEPYVVEAAWINDEVPLLTAQGRGLMVFDGTARILGDTVLQLDVLDSLAYMWVWPAGESMPARPAASLNLKEISDILSVGVAVSQQGNGNVGQNAAAAEFRYVNVDSVPIRGLSALQAGDANRDALFDQFDLVHVQTAAKYLTGQNCDLGRRRLERGTWGPGG